MDHFKNLSLLIKFIIQHLVKIIISIKRTNQKNHVFFMPHAFSQNDPFDQCEHFSQVEPFEKP